MVVAITPARSEESMILATKAVKFLSIVNIRKIIRVIVVDGMAWNDAMRDHVIDCMGYSSLSGFGVKW